MSRTLLVILLAFLFSAAHTLPIPPPNVTTPCPVDGAPCEVTRRAGEPAAPSSVPVAVAPVTHPPLLLPYTGRPGANHTNYSGPLVEENA
eukprot:2646755-Rhodomonas_salina.1